MTITLASGDIIAGSATSAATVNFALYGDEITGTTDAFKLLAQGQLAAAAANMYAPSGVSAIVKLIQLQNTGSTNQYVQIFGDGTSLVKRIYSCSIPASGSASYDTTGWRVYDASGIVQSVGSTGPSSTVAIGTTTTLTPGSSATATDTGTPSAATFNFGIPRGANWQTSSGVPGGGLGQDGDYDLNLTNGDVYGPKASGSWGSVIGNIKGATGSTGPAGAVATVANSDGTLDISGTTNVVASISRIRVGVPFKVVTVFTSNVAITGNPGANDGVSAITTDPVLLVGQTSTPQNGLWIVNTAGAWTRPVFFASGTVYNGGVLAVVASGTKYQGSIWELPGYDTSYTVDTSPQTWGEALQNAAANTGSFGTATQIPTVNVDTKGRVSTASNTPIQLANDTAQLGSLLATNIAAPATPAAGKTETYVDSTSKNFASKNDAGVVNHGVQTHAAGGGAFISGINDDGSVTSGVPAGGVTALTSTGGTVAVSGSGTIDVEVVNLFCRAATVGTETYTIASGSVTTINGTTVDGVALAIGDRVLIKDAPAASGVGSAFSTQPGNGIYTVTANTTNLTVARATDMSGSTNPVGRTVYVSAGTVGAYQMYGVRSPSATAAFTWGTTALQFDAMISKPREIEGTLYIDPLNTQGWAGSDLGAWVNSAYSYITSIWYNSGNQTGGGIIEIAPGNYVQTTAVVANTAGLSITIRGAGDGWGATVAQWSPSSGTAWTLGGGGSNSGGVHLENITISGGGSVNPSTGVNIAGAYGGMTNVAVVRFANGITWISASGAYGWTFLNCKIQFCTTGVAPLGENNVFTGGLIGNCGTGMSMTTSAGAECQLFGVAFDDNTTTAINIGHNNARISLDGCRFENAGNGTCTYITQSAGSISMVSGAFQDDVTTGTAANGFVTQTGGVSKYDGVWHGLSGRVLTTVYMPSSPASLTLINPIVAPGSSATSLAALNWVPTTYDLASTATVVAGTSLAILKQRIVPLNTLDVGSTFTMDEYGIAGTAGMTGTYRIHVGTAGTTADPTVALLTQTATANTQQSMRGMLTVRTVGAAATCVAAIRGDNNATAGSTGSGTTTFNSTLTNFVTLTYASSIATGHTSYAAYIRQEQPT